MVGLCYSFGRIVRALIKHSAQALVVGFGSIARRHIENLEACRVRVLAVVRPSGHAPGAAPHLKFVRTIAEGIALKPDCAIVASSSAAHGEALLPLLEAGVPLYAEKPVVSDAAQLEKVKCCLSQRPTRTSASGCNLRFLPSLRRMQTEIAAGVIGSPVRASFQAGQWLPDWRPSCDYRQSYSAKAAQGGGVILDLIHEIDAARWLLGDFDQVVAMGGKRSRLEIDAEDVACILLGRRGAGPFVSIGLDYVARQRVRRYEVVGDEGTLVWDLAASQLTLATQKETRTLASDAKDFDVDATYLAAMQVFLDAVAEGRPFSPDLADGLAATELALRAKEALHVGEGR